MIRPLLVLLALSACANPVEPPVTDENGSRDELPVGDPVDDKPVDGDDDDDEPAIACGDGVVDPGEACDRNDFASTTCSTLGFDGGTIRCDAHCAFDTSGCNDAPPPPPPAGDPTPIAAVGASVALAGSLDLGDPSWSRPSQTCAASDSPGRRYDVHRVVNNTGAARTLTVTAAFTGDGFLHAYSTFDPAQPESGCVAGDDDGASTSDSEIVAVAINAGAVLTLVVSSYAADAALGAYTLTVATDDGDVTPPPPPPPVAVCGDAVVSGAEVCDGAALDGDTCNGHGFNRGALSCNASCAAVDTAACWSIASPVSIAARGSSITVSGALAATDAKWRRPTESCGAGGAVADRLFDAVQITNNMGTSQTLDLTATFGGDGFLHVFSSTFDPGAPTSGCLRGDDDFNGSTGAQINDVAIASGQTLVIVASSFAANAPIGAWSIAVATKQPAPVSTCGNGIKEGSEVCDGAALAGATCLSRGHEGGALSCNATCGALVESSCWDLEPAVAIAAPGASIAFDGSLTAQDPRMDRVGETCTGTGAADHPWDGFRIVNNGSVARTLTVTADWAGGDGFLHAYTSSFNAQAPLTGCLKGDDDFGVTEGSQITNLSIGAGQTLVIVASSFTANANIGAYDIEVVTNGPPATPVGAKGVTIQLAGSLDAGDPSWTRPSETCTSTGATNRKHDAFRIQNTTGVAQKLTVQGNWSGDGFLHVFGAAFDPASPLSACRKGDDDAGTNASRIAGVDIAAGETVVIVASTFAAGATLGAYTIDVLTEGVANVAAPGSSVVTKGALHASDLKWNRPSESCTDDGGTALNFYDVHQVKNATGAEQELDFTATWTGGDGFLVVYFGTFDPLDGASDQCLDGDDDFNGMTASKVEGLLIFPNEVLTVVASSFAASTPIASYSLDVRTVP